MGNKNDIIKMYLDGKDFSIKEIESFVETSHPDPTSYPCTEQYMYVLTGEHDNLVTQLTSAITGIAYINIDEIVNLDPTLFDNKQAITVVKVIDGKFYNLKDIIKNNLTDVYVGTATSYDVYSSYILCNIPGELEALKVKYVRNKSKKSRLLPCE